MATKIRPLQDRVIVKRLKEEERTKGGLYIPDSAKEKPVEGTVLVGARRFRDLKVSDAELGSLTSVDEPVRQIQAPELVEDAVQIEPMVGRRPRRGKGREMPEADQLVRGEPDLLELVSDSVASADDDPRRASS